tara:strand:+ start:6540 stop:6653 length:114 start_codon:yes stop_codon:yes gene_type:complete
MTARQIHFLDNGIDIFHQQTLGNRHLEQSGINPDSET